MSEKVYIVSTGAYEDYEIKRVFSTRAKAEAWVGPLLRGEGWDGYDGYRIEEHDLDDVSGEPECFLECQIDVPDGGVEVRATEMPSRDRELAELANGANGPALFAMFEGRNIGEAVAGMKALRDALVERYGPDMGGAITGGQLVQCARRYHRMTLLSPGDKATQDVITELRALKEDVEFCCMHIVAADGNVEDESIQWCLREGQPVWTRGREGMGEPLRRDPACETCQEYGKLMLSLPFPLRAEAI